MLNSIADVKLRAVLHGHLNSLSKISISSRLLNKINKMFSFFKSHHGKKHSHKISNIIQKIQSHDLGYIDQYTEEEIVSIKQDLNLLIENLKELDDKIEALFTLPKVVLSLDEIIEMQNLVLRSVRFLQYSVELKKQGAEDNKESHGFQIIESVDKYVMPKLDKLIKHTKKLTNRKFWNTPIKESTKLWINNFFPNFHSKSKYFSSREELRGIFVSHLQESLSKQFLLYQIEQTVVESDIQIKLDHIVSEWEQEAFSVIHDKSNSNINPDSILSLVNDLYNKIDHKDLIDRITFTLRSYINAQGNKGEPLDVRIIQSSFYSIIADLKKELNQEATELSRSNKDHFIKDLMVVKDKKLSVQDQTMIKMAFLEGEHYILQQAKTERIIDKQDLTDIYKDAAKQLTKFWEQGCH